MLGKAQPPPSGTLRMLAKSTRGELGKNSPFETNRRLGRLRAQRGNQRVEGSLATLIAGLPHSPQNLQRREIGCVLQNLQIGFRKFATILGRPICRRARSAPSSTCTRDLSFVMRFTERSETPLNRETSVFAWPAFSKI